MSICSSSPCDVFHDGQEALRPPHQYQASDPQAPPSQICRVCRNLAITAFRSLHICRRLHSVGARQDRLVPGVEASQLVAFVSLLVPSPAKPTPSPSSTNTYTSSPEQPSTSTQHSPQVDASSVFFLSQSQSFIVQLLSGKITSPLFTVSSLLSHLTRHNSPHVMYEAIINAHVVAELPLECTLHLFDEMTDIWLVPTPITFNAVLKYLIKGNEFGKAWGVFEKNKGRVGLDTYTFGILMKGCSKNGDLDRAFQILIQMQDTGLSPNVVVYTTLIDCCFKKGEVEKAKKMFSEMAELGLAPNQHTYTVMINGFIKEGFKEYEFELYERMKNEGMLPDLHTYNCILNAYCVNGKMHKAFQLFDEMTQRGVTCNVVTYNIIAGGARGIAFTTEKSEFTASRRSSPSLRSGTRCRSGRRRPRGRGRHR